MGDDALADRLGRFVARRLGAASARVVHLERSTEGFSQETFVFDVDVARAGGVERRAFVVKREPVAGLLEPYDLEPEFRVLHALSEHPLPSPRTPWFGRNPAILGRPFYVMEKVPGEVPIPTPGPSGEGPFSEPERAALAPQAMRALAELHRVDWKALGFEFLGAPAPGRGAALAELARWRARLDASGIAPAPVMAEALGWLARTAPSTDRVALLHGDYRL